MILRIGYLCVALSLVVGCGADYQSRLADGEKGEEGEEETPPEQEPEYPEVPGNEVKIKDFMKAFNDYRARYQLPAVAYSVSLTEDARENDLRQQRYGLGHHYMGRARAQNAAMGYPDIRAVMNGWHNSSGHRVNMQNRNWTCMGIHKKGRYWTQNFSNWAECK